MDALPISVNQHQLSLMHNAIERTITDLEKQHKVKQFASNDEAQREENLLTYGTNQYDKALTRVETIEEQLKSCLDSWKDKPDNITSVSLSLDSYQLKILRSSLEQEIEQLKDVQDRQRFEDIMEQLPEYSPQEDAD